MNVTRADTLEAILLAMLDRLGVATPDPDGNVDETTQADVDAIAAQADGPVLDALVQVLNRPAPAAGRTPAANELAATPPPPAFDDAVFGED